MVGRIYKSCSELPFSVFVDILVNGNIKKIVRFGWFRESHVKKTWDAIFNEYATLTNDPNHGHMLNMVREYSVLRNKIEIVEHIVSILFFRLDEGLIAVLRKLGFSYKYTEATMANDLKMVIARAKSWVMRAEKLGKSISETQNTTPVKTTDFDEILAELSAFQGYHIDARNITVSQYAYLVNRLKKHVEDGKRGKNNRTNR